MPLNLYESRKATNKLLEAAAEGMLTWQQVAEAALRYLSEAEVAHMADVEGFDELLGEAEED